MNPYNQQGYQAQTIIDGGLYYAASSQEVYNYHVAPGYRMKFLVEGERLFIIKTCYSQFQPPSYEVFDLVQRKQPEPDETDNLKARLAALEEQLKRLAQVDNNDK